MAKFKIVAIVIGCLLAWAFFLSILAHEISHAEPQCCYYGHLRVCPCDR
jgi:hypothetical protein